MTMVDAPRNGNGNGATTTALAERETSFTPFMSKDPIKLSAAIVTRFFCKPTKQNFICSEEQAIRFMMLCKARALNPWEGDAYLVGYDTKDGPEFNLITAHQSFLKRAEAHEAFEGMESGVVVQHNESEEIKDVEGDFIPPDCNLVGGWARVHRKDRKIHCYRRLALSAYSKPFGVWNTNAAGMIVKCAEADALRSSFPNSLAGMYLDGDIAQPIEASAPVQSSEPTKSKADRVLAKIGKDVTTGDQIKAPEETKPAVSATSPATAEPSSTAAAPAQAATSTGGKVESGQPQPSRRPSRTAQQQPQKQEAPKETHPPADTDLTVDQKAEEYVASLPDRQKVNSYLMKAEFAAIRGQLKEEMNVQFLPDMSDEQALDMARRIFVAVNS